MLKIENYIMPGRNPVGVNFKKLPHNLIYDEIIVDGLITEELYYSDEKKADLVVRVTLTYTVDDADLVTKIVFSVRYLDLDNQEARTINKTKVLTPRQQAKLARRRAEAIEQLT